MLLQSNRDANFFYVDWWLLNHCNYKCSYCADIIKNGSIPLPNINHCLEMIRLISSHCNQIKKIPNFTIVGGEITQWPFTVDLLKEIKLVNGIVTIRSNASCGIEDWKNIINFVDTVNMEYHPEFTGESHFLLQIGNVVKNNRRCHIILNMTPEDWNKAENFYDKILSFYPELSIQKKILFDDPIENKQIKKYSKEQIIELSDNEHTLRFYENGKEILADYNTLMLEGKNVFYGKYCNAGIEQIIIDAYGRVAKGHCRNGGHIGRLGKGILFSTEPTRCHRDSCRNGFDIHATKFS